MEAFSSSSKSRKVLKSKMATLILAFGGGCFIQLSTAAAQQSQGTLSSWQPWVLQLLFVTLHLGFESRIRSTLTNTPATHRSSMAIR